MKERGRERKEEYRIEKGKHRESGCSRLARYLWNLSRCTRCQISEESNKDRNGASSRVKYTSDKLVRRQRGVVGAGARARERERERSALSRVYKCAGRDTDQRTILSPRSYRSANITLNDHPLDINFRQVVRARTPVSRDSRDPVRLL